MGFLSLFIFARAFYEPHWSLWAYGDAQTMLAVKNWKEDGFVKLRFLWVPQGYSESARFIDHPFLDHHAHGITLNGRDYRIYTHYPSWYAVPYGFLAQRLIESRGFYQAIAATISLLGLWFFYLFWKRHLGDTYAAAMTALYAFHLHFLGFVDSLSNLPYDDFFRWAFVLVWDRHLREKSFKSFFYCFVVYFFSSLVSIDSIGFIFAWALFYSLIFQRRWKEVPLLLLAPALAVSVCFLQNVAYLGYDLAYKDWFQVYDSESSSFLSRCAAIHNTLDRVFGITPLGCLLVLGTTVYLKRQDRKWLKYFVCLFLAGAVYPFFFSNKVVGLHYQARQFLPLMALVIATLGFEAFRLRQVWARAGAIVLFLAALYTTQFWGIRRKFALAGPVNEGQEKIAKTIERIFPDDKIVFHVGNEFRRHTTRQGTPQVHPVIEYWVDAPFLWVYTLPELERDFINLRRLTHNQRVVVVFNKKVFSPAEIEKAVGPIRIVDEQDLVIAEVQ